jgi:hypothetical protein
MCHKANFKEIALNFLQLIVLLVAILGFPVSFLIYAHLMGRRK